jgi:2-methylaconitate cis-trans-isomerase PrpF
MSTDYTVFFSTDAGQRVLADMLLEGGFFKLNKTPEEQAVENFLKVVLGKTGKYPIEGESSAARITSYIRLIGTNKTRGFVRTLFNMKTEY